MSEVAVDAPVYNEESLASLVRATAWARYWSRSLDIVIWMALVGYLSGALFPITFLKLYDITGGNDYLLGMALLPLVIVIDAITLAAFGQTIGKMIVGIKVEKISGGRLTFGEAVNRNFQVYVKGLALGVPLISLFTLANAHGRVKSGEETSWDEAVETLVVQQGASLARTFLTAALYIFAIFAIRVWDQVTEQNLDREMPRQTDFAASDPIEDQLRAGALEMKASLPQNLDAVTILVDVQVKGRTIDYVHQISRRDVSDETLREYLVANTVPKVCESAEMRQLIDEFEVTYSYSYFMPNSSSPVVLEIDREVCSKS